MDLPMRRGHRQRRYPSCRGHSGVLQTHTAKKWLVQKVSSGKWVEQKWTCCGSSGPTLCRKVGHHVSVDDFVCQEASTAGEVARVVGGSVVHHTGNVVKVAAGTAVVGGGTVVGIGIGVTVLVAMAGLTVIVAPIRWVDKQVKGR